MYICMCVLFCKFDCQFASRSLDALIRNKRDLLLCKVTKVTFAVTFMCNLNTYIPNIQCENIQLTYLFS